MTLENLTKSSCTLTWEPPESDGGSPVKGYFIERTSGFSPRWVKVNKKPVTECQASFKDLQEGTQYEYRVIAVNDAGESKPSETTGVFTAKDPFDKPGKPGQPKVTDLTKDSASLTWDAPEKDGGAEIFNYVVEMKETGDVKWKRVNKDNVPETSYKVDGLKEGREYEFRVTAENKAGQGPASAPSKPAKYGTFYIRKTVGLPTW